MREVEKDTPVWTLPPGLVQKVVNVNSKSSFQVRKWQRVGVVCLALASWGASIAGCGGGGGQGMSGSRASASRDSQTVPVQTVSAPDTTYQPATGTTTATVYCEVPK